MRYFLFLVSGKTYDTQNSSRQQHQPPASGVQPPAQFNGNGGVSSTSESLDLGDLDLSRLRLTKQDLETLSNLTPALPKHFQDQLLAQLPPNQARKLSRTLSMQSSSQTAPVKVYKRSLSGGRDVNDANITASNANNIDSFDRNTIFRRSLSRTRDTESTSRSDDLANPPPSYRYACGDTTNTQQLPPPYKNFDTLPPRLGVSTSKDYIGRPPSGCLSPPPPVSPSDSPVRRRPSQRRISRFLRPDFFDTPQEDSVYVLRNDRSEREIDTQNVLREIRERSRDRATNDYKRERSAEPFSDRSYYSNLDAINIKERRKSSIPSRSVADEATAPGIFQNSAISDITDPPSVRPKSNNLLTQPVNGLQNGFIDYSPSNNGAKQNFTDTILDELATLSNNKNTNSISEENNDNIKRKDKLKVNKIKSKDSIDKLLKSDTSVTNEADKETANNISMVTNLTNEIDSVTTLPKLINNEKPIKKVSKLVRPKSYPSKEQSPSEMPKKLSPERIEELNESSDATLSTSERSTVTNNKIEDTKLVRPKSYPASKIIKPKELKKVTNGVVSSAIAVTSTSQIDRSESSASELIEKSNGLKTTDNKDKPTVVKKVKIVKKIVKVDGKSATKESSPQLKTVAKIAPVAEVTDPQPATKEKSPEKKPRSGFLYSIGQKFEKLRENSKNKVRNSTSKVNVAPTETSTEPVIVVRQDPSSSKVNEKSAPEINLKKTKFSVTKASETQSSNAKTASTVDKDVSILKEEIKSSERKSRIDAMIRNLRERSVPRGPVLTESGLIKRAVSVEDMTGAFNKRAVNRVLGLFKRIEKEHLEVPGSNVKNTKSSSTVDSLVYAASMERPKSSGFVSKLRKGRPYVGAISDTIISLTDQQHQHVFSANSTESKQTSVVDKLAKNYSKIPSTDCNQCLDCNDDGDALNVTKRHSNSEMKQSSEDKERMRNNRKGLVLDFTKLEKLESPPPDYKQAISAGNYKNNNNNVSNNNNITVNSNANNHIHKHYNNTNNNNDDESINTEINANHMLTPSFDSMTHYSSDSRSLIDDCASTSTFLSPTEEPELYFDDWSVCSEDNFGGCASSSPSASRMSRNSQGPSPLTKSNDSSESVIDRIKRRSFYCRFNVDKPKRQTNIVGTAARDYYREAAAKLKSRPADSISSTSAASTFDHSSSTKNTHEYYHPIKSSITSIHRSGSNHYQQPSTHLPPPHHHHHHHHHSHHHHSRSDDITSASVVSAKSMTSAGASSTRSMYDDDLRSYRPSEYMRTKSNYLPLPPSKSSSKITSPNDAHDYRYTPTTDYLSMKAANSSRGAGVNSLAYDPLAPKYGTYNPKRRTSSYSSHVGGTGSAIDTNVSSSNSIASSYATLGRKARPYDHRSTSMMDSSTCNAANSPSTATVTSLYRRDSRTPTDFSTLTAR